MSAQMKKIVTLVILALVAIALVVTNIIGIRVSTTENAVTVQAPFFSETVTYDEIERVEIKTGLHYGTRTIGSDFIGVKAGSFNNAEFGSYRCAVVTSQKSVIALKKTNGAYLVFNVKDSDELNAIAEELRRRTGD